MTRPSLSLYQWWRRRDGVVVEIVNIYPLRDPYYSSCGNFYFKDGRWKEAGETILDLIDCLYNPADHSGKRITRAELDRLLKEKETKMCHEEKVLPQAGENWEDGEGCETGPLEPNKNPSMKDNYPLYSPILKRSYTKKGGYYTSRCTFDLRRRISAADKSADIKALAERMTAEELTVAVKVLEKVRDQKKDEELIGKWVRTKKGEVVKICSKGSGDFVAQGESSWTRDFITPLSPELCAMLDKEIG